MWPCVRGHVVSIYGSTCLIFTNGTEFHKNGGYDEHTLHGFQRWDQSVAQWHSSDICPWRVANLKFRLFAAAYWPSRKLTGCRCAKGSLQRTPPGHCNIMDPLFFTITSPLRDSWGGNWGHPGWICLSERRTIEGHCCLTGDLTEIIVLAPGQCQDNLNRAVFIYLFRLYINRIASFTITGTADVLKNAWYFLKQHKWSTIEHNAKQFTMWYPRFIFSGL
jgi:hypothetical protein